MIYGVQSKDINNWWNVAEPYITDALKYGVGEYTAQDIKKACESTTMQLWLFGDRKEVKGCFVTQILNYPQLSVLLVLLLGGKDFKEHKENVDDTLLRFGKENNCKYVEFFGRKGWGNFLKDLEYKEQVRMFAKEIV